MKKSVHERTIGYTVLGVVAVIACLSLILLYGTAFQSTGKVSFAAKFGLGEVRQTAECNIPASIDDLVVWRSRRKNVPVLSESCPFLVQKYCVTENSGRCLQKCLDSQQGPEGICQGIGFAITGEVTLNSDECRRLADSFAKTTRDVLSRVGAVAKMIEVFNPCSEESDAARNMVYSLSEPLQAYAWNEFSSGDVVGLYANEQKDVDALEYVLCADGRSKVSSGGDERCNSMQEN